MHVLRHDYVTEHRVIQCFPSLIDRIDEPQPRSISGQQRQSLVTGKSQRVGMPGFIEMANSCPVVSSHAVVLFARTVAEHGQASLGPWHPSLHNDCEFVLR
jgi:hypothetical protein